MSIPHFAAEGTRKESCVMNFSIAASAVIAAVVLGILLGLQIAAQISVAFGSAL